jgi:phage gp29-like protein
MAIRNAYRRMAREARARAQKATDSLKAAYWSLRKEVVERVAERKLDTDDRADVLGRSAEPPEGEYEDPPVAISKDWNVREITAVKRAFANGTFYSAALLGEWMMGNARVQTAINGRTKGITKCQRVVAPATHTDQELAKRVAAEYSELIDQILPLEIAEQMMVWMILLGFSVCEVIWEFQQERWIPRLKFWHPMYLFYRMDLRRYTAITQSDGNIEIQDNDPKWFLWAPWGKYRGWMRGAVRSCSISCLVLNDARRDWARWSEVHGLPQKKVKVPATARPEDKQRFFAKVRAAAAEATFMLPIPNEGTGWDVELLETKNARSWEGFERLAQLCERTITLAIRGTNLTTEVDGGAYAASDTHRDEDSDYASADARKFALAFKQQITSFWALYNYGDAGLAPDVSWDTQQEKDTKLEADIASTSASAAQLYEMGGWPIDRQAWASQFNIPLKRKDSAGAEPDPGSGGEAMPTPSLPPVRDESELPEAGAGDAQQPEHGGEVFGRESPTQAGRRLARRTVLGCCGGHDGESVTLSAVSLPESVLAQVQRGHVGQRYVDDVARQAAGRSVAAIAPFLSEVRTTVANATSFEEIRPKLARLLRESRSRELEQIVAGGTVVTSLAGRHAGMPIEEGQA